MPSSAWPVSWSATIPGCLSWAALRASRRNRVASSSLARLPALGILIATDPPELGVARPEDVAERAGPEPLQELELANSAAISLGSKPGRRVTPRTRRAYRGDQFLKNRLGLAAILWGKPANSERRGSAA